MKSIDDINGFKEKTGLESYKILSQYNIGHLTKSWPVLNMVNNVDDNALAISKPTGVADFYTSDKNISNHNHKKPQTVAAPSITGKIDIKENVELSAYPTTTWPTEPGSKMPVDVKSPEKSTSHSQKNDLQKFAGLFSPSTKKIPQTDTAQAQRATPLAQIFGRNTSSCQ